MTLLSNSLYCSRGIICLFVAPQLKCEDHKHMASMKITKILIVKKVL